MSMARAEILVIGSVAVDEVAELREPLRAGSHNSGRWSGRRIGGGAANTAMALARAGDRALVVSAVGADAEGADLTRKLESIGVDCRYINRHAGETTRSLVLLEPAGERTVINLARAAVPLPAGLAKIPAAACYVRSADPALTPVLAQRVQHGGLVMAHLPPVRKDSRPAQILVCSKADMDQRFLADPFAAGKAVAGDALEWVVVTDGPQGAAAYGRHATHQQSATPTEAVDGVGAGDVFAAGLLHALVRDRPMPEALAIAAQWGAASVQYAGAEPPAGFPWKLEAGTPAHR